MYKTALITGASLGIGYELARVFAQNRHHLVLVARSTEKLNALASELEQKTPGIRVTVITQDLSIPGSGLQLFEELNRRNISVDLLVNNAGFGDYGLFHECSLEKQLKMIDLNVRSLTELTHCFGKEMVKKGDGKIMNVASVAAFQPGPLMSVYYSTKHFVLALSEGLANEWEPFGVTVTALCPGPTESGFMEAANMGKSKLFKNFRLPSSEEVASYGYQAMMNGKRVAVHGMMNKLLSSTVGFFPRNFVTSMVRKVQDRI